MRYKRRYDTHKEFDAKVDDYVATCQLKGEPLTITGLCLHLGFSSRTSLDSYAKNSEFTASVERARLLVENSYELDLRAKGKSPVGSIFALKQMSWSDQQKIEISPEKSFLQDVFAVVEAQQKQKKEEDA